jgi:hypothetical protein
VNRLYFTFECQFFILVVNFQDQSLDVDLYSNCIQSVSGVHGETLLKLFVHKVILVHCRSGTIAAFNKMFDLERIRILIPRQGNIFNDNVL